MSSIRFYILGSLAERGPLHGHALRQLAEEEHVHEWTDISVGALYGALKRMHADGLVAVERTEREGNYPERQVYGITADGERALLDIRAGLFSNLDFRTDSFDLALSSLDPDGVDDLAGPLQARRDAYAERLRHAEEHFEEVGRYLWLAERLTWQHKVERLRTEVAWHDRLLEAVPEIIADEKERRHQRGRKS